MIVIGCNCEQNCGRSIKNVAGLPFTQLQEKQFRRVIDRPHYPLEMLSQGSNLACEWECDHGHLWTATPYTRLKEVGCPYCRNFYVSPEKSLAMTHPKLAQEWHPTKNEELKPYTVSYGYDKPVWWQHFDEKTQKWHEWPMSPMQRTVRSQLRKNTNGKLTKPQGCSLCAGKRIVAGVNDNRTLYPEASSQWKPELNNGKNINDFIRSSQELGYFVCDNGHTTYVSIASRLYWGHGCSECYVVSSDMEVAMQDYIKSTLIELGQSEVEVVTNTRQFFDNGTELDVYLPELHLAFEFNGLYWHSEETGKIRNYHLQKWNYARGKDTNLFFVWEDDWNERPNETKEAIRELINQAITKTSFIPIPQKPYENGNIFIGLPPKSKPLQITRYRARANKSGYKIWDAGYSKWGYLTPPSKVGRPRKQSSLTV